MQIIKFTFQNYEKTEQVSGTIRVGDDGIGIFVDGYGEKTSNEGAIISIEKYEGKLTVLIWDDIEQEDPQIINLEGASESLRLPD